MLQDRFGERRLRSLMWIGQVSAFFALIVLTVRNYLVFPAHGFISLAVLLLVGFLPSYLFSLIWKRHIFLALILNALVLVSIIFAVMDEWALSGVFVLVPVFSLLFKKKQTYLVASISSLLSLGLLSCLRISHSAAQQEQVLVNIMDSGTVFLVLIFLIYFIVTDVLNYSVQEAKTLQNILALTKSVEARDIYTYGHSERVASLGRWIAQYHRDIDPQIVYESGLIHDVGKLAVPDLILLKSERLTDVEYDVIRRHTLEGANICESLGISRELTDGVRYHHERWDGRGYPEGLSGTEIPLIGRILSVADSIDAMASNRAYRKALELSQIRAQIEGGRGSQFDPDIADTVLERWIEVAELIQVAQPPSTSDGRERIIGP